LVAFVCVLARAGVSQWRQDRKLEIRKVEVLSSDPAFLYQSFEWRMLSKGGNDFEEKMYPMGTPEWRVRFLPSKPGAYSVRIEARDHSGSTSSLPVTWTATSP
jgi:hypothetical protein